jgi:hypothetical protein
MTKAVGTAFVVYDKSSYILSSSGGTVIAVSADEQEEMNIMNSKAWVMIGKHVYWDYLFCNKSLGCYL